MIAIQLRDVTFDIRYKVIVIDDAMLSTATRLHTLLEQIAQCPRGVPNDQRRWIHVPDAFPVFVHGIISMPGAPSVPDFAAIQENDVPGYFRYIARPAQIKQPPRQTIMHQIVHLKKRDHVAYSLLWRDHHDSREAMIKAFLEKYSSLPAVMHYQKDAVMHSVNEDRKEYYAGYMRTIAAMNSIDILVHQAHECCAILKKNVADADTEYRRSLLELSDEDLAHAVPEQELHCRYCRYDTRYSIRRLRAILNNEHCGAISTSQPYSICAPQEEAQRFHDAYDREIAITEERIALDECARAEMRYTEAQKAFDDDHATYDERMHAGASAVMKTWEASPFYTGEISWFLRPRRPHADYSRPHYEAAYSNAKTYLSDGHDGYLEYYQDSRWVQHATRYLHDNPVYGRQIVPLIEALSTWVRVITWHRHVAEKLKQATDTRTSAQSNYDEKTRYANHLRKES